MEKNKFERIARELQSFGTNQALQQIISNLGKPNKNTMEPNENSNDTEATLEI